MPSLSSDRASSPYRKYAEKLPSLPAVALEVVSLTKKEWVDLAEMSSAIGRDPALAAKILKLANSPLYGRRCQVATLADAVKTLGINSLKMAALSFSVVSATGAQDELGGYDLKEFWRRTLVQSVAARGLARAFRGKGADEAFTLGLLMDLSVPVFCRVAGAKYKPVVEAMDAGHPDWRLEEQQIGATHNAMSATLMEEWGLPSLMTKAALYHHDPDAVPPELGTETADFARLMNLAHLCADVMTSARKGEALAELKRLSAKWFGRTEDEAFAVVKGLSPSVEELAEIVNVDMGGDLNASDILDYARQEMVQLSLSTSNQLSQVEVRVHELEKTASTDALTALNNRAAFDAALQKEWSRRRGEELPDPLGLIMIDVDHFKKFNDTYGHQAGDDVLRAVGGALKLVVRETDRACRYGGEEFVVVAPYAAGSMLKALGERLRRAIEKLEIVCAGTPRKVTASFGVAALTTDPGDRKPEDLLKRADEALYKSKETGRNRVTAADDY